MKKIHIVPHTHWDREWYKPFHYFRAKLVYVIDALLKIMENNNDYSHFLFDGQTIPLEDYLKVHPENRERLRKLINAGRISVGPWYILPDEFAPDGESMIRNLMIGTRISREFGEPMMVGYLPDSFGHSGQMPHILNGFGIGSAVVMRGVDAEAIQSTEFIWRGINSDTVMGVYLPLGYSNGMFLPKEERPFKYRIRFTMQRMKKWTATRHILIMNGVDHQFPQAHVGKQINRLNKESKTTEYTISSLEEYIADVNAEDPDLPSLQGDLLIPSRNRVHSSIASTRIYQKQMNRRMEALLEKYVEPIAVIAWLKNAEYQHGLINDAWKRLIQNQTHDGICGCCLDEVHKEMDQRFTDVKNIGETLQNTYARAIAQRISCESLKLVVFNNALVKGKQFVRATIFTQNKIFTLRDGEGNEIPYQVTGIEEVDLSEKSIWTLYLKGKEPAFKIEIEFEIIFAFHAGYKVFSIDEGKKPAVVENELKVNGNTFENALIKCLIHPNGSIDLYDKESGKTFSGLHVFEDCGDAGDTYNYSPVKHDRVVTSDDVKAQMTITQTGPVFIETKVDLEMQVSARLSEGDLERSNEWIGLPIQTWIRIYKGQKRVEFKTTIDNQVEDHRLRVLFPTEIQTDKSHAETQFGTITRDIHLDNKDWKKKKWHEKPLPIYSQQRYVALHDNASGFAVLNRGLPEYEIYSGDRNTVAVTLVRGVGMMGKSDLLIRPGRPSGIVSPTPDAQCKGRQTLEYAVLVYDGENAFDVVPHEAVVYDARPLAVQSHLGYKKLLRKYGMLLKLISMETLTGHVSDELTEIDAKDFACAYLNDDRLQISAVKKAEKGHALVVRVYNPGMERVDEAVIKLGVSAAKGYKIDFNEENPVPLEQNMDKYSIPLVAPNTALTLKFDLM